MTQYLFQQQDSLPTFGQVVGSEAALDTCPDHNGIPEISLSSHSAHLATQPQSQEGESKQKQLQEEKGKQSPAWPAFPQSPGAVSLTFSLPQSLAQGLASTSPAEQSW